MTFVVKPCFINGHFISKIRLEPGHKKCFNHGCTMVVPWFVHKFFCRVYLSAKDADLDNAIYTWFIQQRAERTPISGMNIKDQAAPFNRMLHPDDGKFQAPQLQRWTCDTSSDHTRGAAIGR